MLFEFSLTLSEKKQSSIVEFLTEQQKMVNKNSSQGFQVTKNKLPQISFDK